MDMPMNSSIRLLKHFLCQPHVFALALTVMLASACAIGPTYQRPAVALSDNYKEAQNWKPAAPADALDRGPWWMLFDDAVLNELTARIDISNQNVAAAIAAYAQARAIVKEQRATLFPAVSL